MALYLSSLPLAEFVTHIYPKLSFKKQADGAVLKLQLVKKLYSRKKTARAPCE